MPVDIILVTETGLSIPQVSTYSKDSGSNFIVVYFNREEGDRSIPVHDLEDGTKFTLIRASKYQTLSLAINKAISTCKNKWVLIINDSKYSISSQVKNLEKIADTIPRLASIRASRIPGLSPVRVNPVFGTMFAVRVLNEVLGFDPTVPDLSLVAYDWGVSIGDKGWANFTAYLLEEDISPRSVSDGSISDKTIDPRNCDYYIAPKKGCSSSWNGGPFKKPWHYNVTIVIPHYGNNFRLLMSVIESWRLQFEKPYIVIYDTGTPSENHESLLSLSNKDVEVNLCRWNGLKSLYDCVALAYNYGMASCRTKYILFTHNDVVPLSQTVLTDLMSSCFDDSPVVGYESQLKGYVGTHLTMAYMPVMRKIRASWDICPENKLIEEGFGKSIKFAGIIPRFIGKELSLRYKTPHFDHVGSMTLSEIYFNIQKDQIDKNRDSVIQDVEKRLMIWQGS